MYSMKALLLYSRSKFTWWYLGGSDVISTCVAALLNTTHEGGEGGGGYSTTFWYSFPVKGARAPGIGANCSRLGTYIIVEGK